ncbi:AhpC/TSA family protein [Ancylomarina euxinus]|uniref:AhpC/TSA family protein n=1 Tax=Ancylomarina euxinus TaxID=2283627 RepID=A0A425XY56_9BACT|nr:TlpA disulfide reductase family protein [Ancylomarina euxinus]MCZ4695955.1 TlpA disulfide reductase family protein [Ancylomarina euxinus]MUP16327.1 redoxin domain-containing protein [Ancylomarina euxinus]RRG19723.1 AhpC/TSA family protein [Ancylomarina euxinus]
MRLLISLLCIAALFSCSKKNEFILNGTIKGVTKDKIVLGTFDRASMTEIGIDTVEVNHGRFSFKSKSLKTSFYSLKLINADVIMGVILENGEITLSADVNDAEGNYIRNVKLEGAINQSLVDQFHNMKEAMLKQDKYANCKEIAEQLKNASSNDEYEVLNRELNRLAPDLENEVNKAKMDLIRHNINKFFVPQVFSFIKQIASIEEIKELYALLPENAKNDPSIIRVKKDIEAKERIQVGKTAPDFTLKTPEGTKLSLSSLKGKVVLVDFWASWCKPCRASFPHMKELYEKYHSKGFEILGVTNDNNHKAWKKAIESDEIPWFNVADEFPVNPAPARVISEYGMDYLPSTVLIDKDGIIIAKLLHGEELDDKLKEIFGF